MTKNRFPPMFISPPTTQFMRETVRTRDEDFRASKLMQSVKLRKDELLAQLEMKSIEGMFV